jgi:hypothetical protein
MKAMENAAHQRNYTGTRGVWLSLIIGIALAGCGATSSTATHPASSGAPTATPTVPIVLKTVQDPAHTFTLRVPTDWQMKDHGGNTYGNSKLGISIDSVGYRFASPASAQMYFDVTVGVYQTSRQHTLLCQSPPFPPNQMFHGLPSAAIPNSQQWFIYTQHAYFALNDYYPGAAVFGSRPQGATPEPTPPPAQVQSDQALINQIRESFTPQPSTPLTCP